MTTCKNCAHEFDGKFCPHCGQKAKTSRITFRQVLQDVRAHFIHFDQGFLFTIKELATRPGHSIREYIAGKRVKHVKPLKFMFWASAISFLIINLLGFQEKLIKRLEAEQGVTVKQHAFGQKFADFVMGHPSLMMFYILPGVAFCSWLLFRKKQLNYAEHFTLAAFLMGALSLISVFTNLVYLTMQNANLNQIAIIGVVQWLVWITYIGWVYSQFVEQPRKVGAWLKGALVLIGGYTVMILLSVLVASTMLYFFRDQITALFE